MRFTPLFGPKLALSDDCMDCKQLCSFLDQGLARYNDKLLPVQIVGNKLLGSFAGQNEIHAEYSSLFSDACYVYIFKDLKPYVVQAPVRL